MFMKSVSDVKNGNSMNAMAEIYENPYLKSSVSNGGFISAGVLLREEQEGNMHHHPFCKILYCTKGRGVVHLPWNTVAFHKNDIICIPKGMDHQLRLENECENILIAIDDFIQPHERQYKLKDTSYLDIYPIFLQIYRQYSMKQRNWYGIVESLLDVFRQYVIAKGLEECENPYVASFKRLLSSNISTIDFNLNDAMDTVPFSKDYFRKLFKQETGVTPLEYLTTLRIEHAKGLLSSTSLTVRQIAAMVGYDDPYYFSRIFKKATGKSPSQWVCN